MVIPAVVLSAIAAASPIAVVDDAGATVSLQSAATRVVSLSPGATEIVFALDAGQRIVGTCSACDYPRAAKACPKVGDFSSVSTETLLARKPDLVLVTAGAQRELAVRLRALGVTSVVLAPASVAGVFGNIAILGRLLGREAAADALVGRLKRRLRELTAKAARRAGGKGPVVYFEIWGDPLMAVGERSYTGELLRLAGARNAAAGLTEEIPRISAERVIAANPEVILLPSPRGDTSAIAQMKRRAGWDALAAVRRGAVHDGLDMDTLVRPGPRLDQGLEQLIRLLYGTR